MLMAVVRQARIVSLGEGRPARVNEKALFVRIIGRKPTGRCWSESSPCLGKLHVVSPDRSSDLELGRL